MTCNWNNCEDDQCHDKDVPSVEISKVQTDHRKEFKAWAPMQPNDVRDSGCIETDDGISAKFHHVEADCKQNCAPDHLFDGAATEPLTSPYASSNQTLFTSTHNDVHAATSVIASGKAKANQEDKSHRTTAEIHALLFGNLPDPIKLSEQTGLFDGQVVFIGHPNRDVSAHQWSSRSFQWMNIGRYVSSGGQIEGSLASDHVRGADESQGALEYFKTAAENRQRLFVDLGSPEHCASTADREPRSEANVGAPTVHTRDDYLLNSQQSFSHTRDVVGEILTPTIRDKFTKQALEDPFVSTSSGSILHDSESGQAKGRLTPSARSLDLTYRFPFQSGTADAPLLGGSGTTGTKSTASPAATYSFKSTLQATAFGESTSHPEVFSVNSDNLQLLRTSTARQSHHSPTHSGGTGKVSQSTLPRRNAAVSSLRLSACPVVPATCTTSGLNTTAVSYASITGSCTKSGASKFNAVTLEIRPASLHYSDPDGSRRDQRHEVANGLDQQTPTPQTFKGPFFTESKPTTHDPTVALSVRISEEDKLENWFRDGHRVARQMEYTKSLMVAAAASDRAGRAVSLGKASARVEESPHANTAPFVRLYENLFEYVEEFRNNCNGNGRPYFTRGWKSASVQLREVGVDDNASYFSKRSAHSRWPRVASSRPSERLSERQMWG